MSVDFGRKMLKIPTWTHKYTENHPLSTTATTQRGEEKERKTKSRVQAGLLPAVEGLTDRHSLIPHPPLSPVPSVTPSPTWICSEWGGGVEMPQDQ